MVRIADGALQFDGNLSGNLVLVRKQFHSDEDEKIDLGAVYEGDRRVTLPQQLRPGLYDLRCGNAMVSKDLFLGEKPIVQWSSGKYKNYENESIYRHRLMFADLNVMPGEDFWLSYGGRILQLPSTERSSSFDFLFEGECLELHLSEELRAFIELPVGGK